MNPLITKLEDTMHQGMIENFKEHGYLTPVLFYLLNNESYVEQIPMVAFKNKTTKQALSNYIKKLCLIPGMEAIGIIMEAYGASATTNDPIMKEYENGKKEIKDFPSATDVIMMILSTPENEKEHVYNVDVKNKKILEKYPKAEGRSGIFSNFFYWKNN